MEISLGLALESLGRYTSYQQLTGMPARKLSGKFCCGNVHCSSYTELRFRPRTRLCYLPLLLVAQLLAAPEGSYRCSHTPCTDPKALESEKSTPQDIETS